MKRIAKWFCFALALVALCACAQAEGGENTPMTPYEIHGALHVADGRLLDQSGAPLQLRGMSTHGLAWFPEYVNEETFRFLRDEWHMSCVRLAMYTEEYGGYCAGGDQEALKALVCKGVDAAAALGMYVIIDWHILSDQDPCVHQEEAIRFFDELARRYADSGNVLYEICNEPNGAGTWERVSEYANAIIPVIRAAAPNSVILVGTPTWSQDVDQALNKPLAFDNIMYTLHFYAGTHKLPLRLKLEKCLKAGLPVFISEFGICDASGDGALDYDSAEAWRELIDAYGLSHMCWNLAHKDESSSILKADCRKLSDWTDDDLNPQGVWMRDWAISRANTP